LAKLNDELTLGPEPSVSFAAFARDVFTTRAGWAMILVGVGVGFLFVLLVLAISMVSFSEGRAINCKTTLFRPSNRRLFSPLLAQPRLNHEYYKNFVDAFTWRLLIIYQRRAPG
jgi:hypothetical protein